MITRLVFHARQVGRPFAVSCSVDVPAERRKTEGEERERADQQPEEHGIGNDACEFLNREEAHHRRCYALRIESAGEHHADSEQHRVHAQRPDHRWQPQVGDAGAVEETDGRTDNDPERYREAPPPGIGADAGDGGGGDGGGGKRPRNRQVDVAEQNDRHHSDRDDPEERCDLKLLQQIVRRQELRVENAADKDQHHDAGRGNDHRFLFTHDFAPKTEFEAGFWSLSAGSRRS